MSQILVVEDDLYTSHLIRNILESIGYAVVEAANAIRGMELAREIHPALILMDIRLPGVDGWEAIRRFKSDPVLSIIPIIALTAQTRPEDREHAHAVGCADFISKPFDVKNFTATIHRYMRAQH